MAGGLSLGAAGLANAEPAPMPPPGPVMPWQQDPAAPVEPGPVGAGPQDPAGMPAGWQQAPQPWSPAPAQPAPVPPPMNAPPQPAPPAYAPNEPVIWDANHNGWGIFLNNAWVPLA